MHHSLRFYGEHRHTILRLYMALARLVRVPVVGRLVRRAANTYGQRGHHSYLLSQEQAEQIIDASDNVALAPCSCRQVFHNCDAPIMTEIVVGVGTEVFSRISPNGFRKVSKDEAKAVLRQCRQKGLIHTLSRCRGDFYAICNCCTCCCVPTRLRQRYGMDYALVRDEKAVDDFRRQQLSPSSFTELVQKKE